MTEPESGFIQPKRDKNRGVTLVRWSMSADEARELADFFDLVTSPGDLARKDAAALREAADIINPAVSR